MAPSFWDLLQVWFDDKYSEFKILEFKKLDQREGAWSHTIRCKRCMAGIMLKWDEKKFYIFSYDVVEFQPSQPEFKFDEALDIKIAQHLWHHQAGYLYEQGWRPEKGRGVW